MQPENTLSMSDEHYMRLALQLAQQGEGSVEPNPMVGCVIVQDNEIIGQGWHQQFGGPHAEINALNSASDPSGATAYVTLEPCTHVGKTGPCVMALIQSGIARVVIACRDPNPQVSGKGIDQLQDAGVVVTLDVLRDEARLVMAPYLKRIATGKPWVIAKWAMTLDGKIASSSGDSQWISNEESRKIVHQIRGRVDGVMVGIGTALADDPMLNARPEGSRVAMRIVVDSTARIPADSRLVETSRQFPTMISVGPNADDAACMNLQSKGCEIFKSPLGDPNQRLNALLDHLAAKGMTNVLVEGGGKLLGALNDLGQIDEVHVFIAPKIIGGEQSISPVGGAGKSLMKLATQWNIQQLRQIGDDIYLVGRPCSKPSSKT